MAGLQLYQDTAANFTSNNPVLENGRPAYETDTGNQKIGDGSTEWTALRYHVKHRTGNAQTGTTYTLAMSDTDDIVTMSNAAANTLTIPTNASVAFPVGTKVEIWARGAGTTTIAGDTGVTLEGNGGSVSAGSCDIQTQYGGATLTKIDTNVWMVGGDIDTVA